MLTNTFENYNPLNSGITNMSYLKDFSQRIAETDYPGFLKIWEEYCYSDEVDAEELRLILEAVKDSDLAVPFGNHVERVIPLWRLIQDPLVSHEILKLIIDIETTQTDTLYELVLNHLNEKYKDDPNLHEKFRLVGLRNSENFQSAIRNFDLLTHMAKGKFVFHTGGWGTGEIIDISLLREELSLEFDFVVGLKHLSFENAFKNLVPIKDDHFLARRFGNPDQLEKDAKEKPVEVIRLLLRDLGPKTAVEIKDELCDLVIPAKEWNRWWQNARAKIKKDTRIESPKEMKRPFKLLKEEIPHEVSFYKELEAQPKTDEIIQMVYSFLRDFPETLKNQEFKNSLEQRMKDVLVSHELNESQQLQVHFFLQDLSPKRDYPPAKEMIEKHEDIRNLIREMEIVAFKKRALVLVQKVRKDWQDIFLDLLFTINQNILRDYILAELQKAKIPEKSSHRLNDLIIHPLSYPDVFIWYFQKLIKKADNLPFSTNEGKNRFFEGFLILLDHTGSREGSRDLGKKMVSILTNGRYKVVRDIMKHSSLEEVKEYLLLATKCEMLTDHDIKIIHSLAEVVYPTLSKMSKKQAPVEEDFIWTTQEGFSKVKERIHQIATVETVQNAKEIEAARALGDLRENAEFKAALERRDRLQAELKFLSDQVNKARVITPQDVHTSEVGVGNVINCSDSSGKPLSFTILGPWDADPERNILSFQSKLAKAMLGKKVGQKFNFQGEEFTISNIENYLSA